MDEVASAVLCRRMFLGCAQMYTGCRVTVTLPKESFFAQIWDWILSNDAFGEPTKQHRVEFATLHAYNFVMWTIPLEFKGLMLVFVLLLALSRVRQFWKSTIVLALVAVYSSYKAHWTYWLCSSGMFLANYVRHMRGLTRSWPRD